MDFSIFKGGLFISAIFWQNKDVLGLIRKDIICSVEKKHPTLNSILLFQAPKKTHMKILLSMIRAPRLLTGIFYHMDHIYLIVLVSGFWSGIWVRPALQKWQNAQLLCFTEQANFVTADRKILDAKIYQFTN